MRAWIRSIAVVAVVVAAPTLSAQAATKPAKTSTASSAPAATTPAPATTTAKTTAAAAPQQAKSTAAAEKPPKTAMVDINKATEAELEALPGIGKALAPKIIAGRPYAKKSELVSKKILTEATYEKVKGHIVAHQ